MVHIHLYVILIRFIIFHYFLIIVNVGDHQSFPELSIILSIYPGHKLLINLLNQIHLFETEVVFWKYIQNRMVQ